MDENRISATAQQRLLILRVRYHAVKIQSTFSQKVRGVLQLRDLTTRFQQ
jgi:hypothetical protein